MTPKNWYTGCTPATVESRKCWCLSSIPFSWFLQCSCEFVAHNRWLKFHIDKSFMTSPGFSLSLSWDISWCLSVCKAKFRQQLVFNVPARWSRICLRELKEAIILMEIWTLKLPKQKFPPVGNVQVLVDWLNVTKVCNGYMLNFAMQISVFRRNGGIANNLKCTSQIFFVQLKKAI